jgi:hypothetical protein
MSTNDSAATAADDKGTAASGAGSFDLLPENNSMQWEGKKPEELAALPEAELAGMSHQDIEKAFGLDIPDRTRVSNPTGAMTVEEADRAVESGAASIPTEEMIAAAAVEALTPPKAESTAAAPAQAEAAKAPEDASAATAAETASQVEQVEEKPAVVAARDGKGTIPYSVLEAARARAAQLENELAMERGEKQRKAEEESIKGALTAEQIAAMRGEFPDAVVDAIEAQNNAIIEIRKENLELRRKAGASEVDPVEDAKQRVTDLIDQDPVLSKWRDDADQTNWKRATAFDDVLRADPVWAEKPLEERFSEVRRLMGAPKEAPVQTGPTEAQQVASRAAAAAAAATASATAPTHSDLPGGHPPASNDASRVDQLSTTQLEKMFESGADVDALLARLG